MHERLTRVRRALAEVGQEHVLRFAPRLSPDDLAHLLAQVEGLDLARVARLLAQVLAPPEALASDLIPAEVVALPDDEASLRRDATARAAGEALLAAGRVAALLVAGGQGTRLGFPGPKGRFPIGPLTGRSLFAYHAQRVLATCRRYDATLPLYVMTSPENHASTIAAFEEAAWFGLDPAQVFFFRQGVIPAVDRDGRFLLAAPHALALAPDGHGGCFHALQVSGALDDMSRRGVQTIFYFQVDNPLARVFDPVFLGHHAGAAAEMSTKVVAKAEPGEKVGVLARRGGRACLVEYSDLDPSRAAARRPDGGLLFWAGNIAIHALELSFARRLTRRGEELPVHRALKNVPYVDAAGDRIEPSEPNAIKLETFVFDALPMAHTTVTQEVRREDEFAPVKNRTGVDSPETARKTLSDQAKRWMSAASLTLPEGPAEVGPLFALDQEDFLATLTRADFGPVFDRSA